MAMVSAPRGDRDAQHPVSVNPRQREALGTEVRSRGPRPMLAPMKIMKKAGY
jgi:hypothetical protein